MSMDYNCYLFDLPQFSSVDFNKFTSDIKLDIQIHPKLNISKHKGFIKFSVTGNFLPFNKAAEVYFSGFEFSLCEPSNPETSETDEICRTMDTHYGFIMSCGSHDSFENLLVYLFSLYFCQKYNACFYDPQHDVFIQDSSDMIQLLGAEIQKLQNEYYAGTLKTHLFSNWD